MGEDSRREASPMISRPLPLFLSCIRSGRVTAPRNNVRNGDLLMSDGHNVAVKAA